MAQVRESDGMANGNKALQVEEGEGAVAETNQGGKRGKTHFPPRIIKPVAIPPQGWPPP